MSNVIILAYANDNEKSLKHLERENTTIYNYLQFNNRGEFNVRNLKNASFQELMNEFAAHKENIVLFHFSGHAAMAQLFFQNEAAVKVGGLAALLSLAPNLEMVFLNGCGTSDQVAILHGETKLQIPPVVNEKGVKRVIATATKVFDATAADFAIYFYSAFCRYWNVGQSFDYAKASVLAGEQSHLFPEGPARHVGSRFSDNKNAEFPWGIYYKKMQMQDALEAYLPLDEYTLPDKAFYREVQGEYIPNQLLIKTIGSKGKVIYDRLTEQMGNDGFDAEREEFSELQGLYKKFIEGRVPTINDLANRIVNMLPKPLGSLLRQMISQAIEIRQNPGPSYENLLDLQLRLHDTMVKLCCFTMLSDLFNIVDACHVKLNKVQHRFLNDFFDISKKDKDTFDFIAFRKIIREILISNTANPFVKEYFDPGEQEDLATNLFNSHMLIRGIRTKKQLGKLGPHLAGFCQSVEDELARIFDRDYFILRYKLLVIRNVEAIRTRTIAAKTYKHKVLLLRMNVSDLPDENELYNIDDYTETHSVIVVRGLNRIIDYLSLSPFVIDRNVLTNDDNSELYFFSFNENGLVYESVKDPSRVLELQVNEEKEMVEKNGKQVEEISYSIPYVDKLPGKTFYEKASIVNRLVLIRNQFEYMRKKIKAIVPTDSENRPDKESDRTETSGGKAA